MANIWREAVPTTSSAFSKAQPSGCEQYLVPAGTLVFFDDITKETKRVVLESAGGYVPSCYSKGLDDFPAESAGLDQISYEAQPFYGSVIPIAYTISATTIVAWLLFILLLIAQKRRPWFQKFMMLFVSVSLTVFLVRTTHILEQQYSNGYHDAEEVRRNIFGSTAFRVLEILCVIIVWIAHLQVLLRLFDRAKERIAIQWLGIVLAIIDLTLWSLVNFYVPYHTHQPEVSDVIPVLAYLFQITIQVVYAGAVIIYSIRKRKFAYHRTSLVTAVICLGAVFLPLIFFILDLADYRITGWSEFIRWVTDAAASVVLWEWIDAVERLEKEHHKTGVLGRQIYEDEDDMDFRELVNRRNSKASGTSSGTDGAKPTSSQEDEQANQTLSKRINGRSIFPSIFRLGKNRWIVSRAPSTVTDSTSYGVQIPLNTLPPTSRPAATDNDQASIPAPQTLTPPPQNSSAPTSPQQYVPTLNPAIDLSSRPTSSTPVRISPIVELPKVSPNKAPSPLVRHMHPLRRSTRQNTSSSSEPICQPTTESPTPGRSRPPLSSSASSQQVPSSNVQQQPSSTPDDFGGDDDDDEEFFTVLRSDGFELQNSSSQMPSTEEAPPSFEPDPGFSVGDYWDDKHPPITRS